MNIVDLVVGSDFNYVNGLVLGLVFLGQVVMSGISLYMMIYIGQIIVARLRKDLWEHVISLPTKFFDNTTSGETMSRITHDTDVVKNFFLQIS